MLPCDLLIYLIPHMLYLKGIDAWDLRMIGFRNYDLSFCSQGSER